MLNSTNSAAITRPKTTEKVNTAFASFRLPVPTLWEQTI